MQNIVANLTSQSLVIKSMWDEAFSANAKHWQSSITTLPRNIYNFTTRYLNNTLPTLTNMVKWKKAINSLCVACLKTQTLQHVVSGCNAHLEEEDRYTWRHNSVLMILSQYMTSVKKDFSIFVEGLTIHQL